MDLVLITRWGSNISRHTRGESGEWIDLGGDTDKRVYVTWERDIAPGIYSSTEDRSKATRFERRQAERLVESKWRRQEPAIEDA